MTALTTVHAVAVTAELYSQTIMWVARRVGVRADHPASPLTEQDAARIRAFMVSNWPATFEFDDDLACRNAWGTPPAVFDAREIAQLWFTLPDLAEAVGVPPAAVRQWISRGKLAPVFTDEDGPLFAIADFGVAAAR